MVTLYDKNLTLGSGRCSARHYMDRLLPMVMSRRHDVTAIITHRLPLQAEAYELFDKKRDGCIKVVMDPWRE
jgi:threonine dehydrogenase-like Zn-dependent dehydrogenase